MTTPHTRIGGIAIGDSDFTVVAGIEKDDGTDGTKVLGVLDLEAAEKTAIADENNLALDGDAEVDESLEVID